MSDTAERQGASPAARGSSMSAKQIAYAAVAGRKVSITPLSGEQVVGYVVGADDYHWLIAHSDFNLNEQAVGLVLTLVHKSAPLVQLDPRSTLSEEPLHEAIEEVGRGFWSFCERTYLGRTEPSNRDAPRERRRTRRDSNIRSLT